MSRHSVDLRSHGGPQFLAANPYCGICHHYIPLAPILGQVDHIISPALRPDLAYDPRNWQPAHGIAGCPECPPNQSRDKRRKGQPTRCNQAKGNRPHATIPTGRTW